MNNQPLLQSAADVRARVRSSSSNLPRLAGRSAAAVLAGMGLLIAGCGDSGKESAAGSGDQPSAAVTAPIGSGADQKPFVMPDSASPTTPSGPSTPADEAWAALEKAFSTPPQPPESWGTQQPSKAEIAEFQKSRGAAAEKVAEVAKAFYTQFGSDPRAGDARMQEFQLLDAAVKMGHTNALVKLAQAEKERLSDPSLPEDERLGLRMMAAQRSAEMLVETEGEEKAKAAMAESVRDLIREFPGREEPYQVLLSLVSDGPVEAARATAQSMVSTNTNVPESVREAAQGLLARLDRVGKPVDIQFTSVDGQKIDLTAMQGKVVLVDFWATWCQPCVVELPNVKAAYEKLHPKGFEIVGISFDQKKATLESFVAREKMTWPQYFDGKGWENELGQRFGITSIPAMWLIDKKGNLRDLSARDDLEGKVEKLLAEPDGAAAN